MLISGMKNIILSWRNNALRKKVVKRETVSFESATKFGFVCESLVNYQALQPILKEITGRGHFTKVLVQVDKRDSSSTNFPSFNSNDVDWKGVSKSSSIDIFTHEPFDYLFYFGERYNPIIESIILRNPAQCRVGFFQEEKAYLYDFMYDFNPEKDRLNNIKDVLETLKKIK